MTKLIGYARVSSSAQDLQLQLNALIEAGCSLKDIYVDKVSGSTKERPGLNKCLSRINEGDTLVVWRLDRLGRTMLHLVSLIDDLSKKGIGFKSLCDGHIDTSTASGELTLNIFSSLAQFEKRLIQERTKAGLEAARARGRLGGRKKLSPTDASIIMAKSMHKNHNMDISTICKTLKISRTTFYRYLSIDSD